MTDNLGRHVAEHRAGEVPEFTQQYHCSALVYSEHFREIRNAITREKQLKGRREKNNALIAKENPFWKDLASEWF